MLYIYHAYSGWVIMWVICKHKHVDETGRSAARECFLVSKHDLPPFVIPPPRGRGGLLDPGPSVCPSV